MSRSGFPSPPTPGPRTLPSPRVFVLSPANLSGARGRRVLAGQADAPFMEPLRRGSTAPLGDVYTFVSSLYYRGKRAYSRAFGQRERGPVTLVVTPTRGLVDDAEPVTLTELRAFAACDIDPSHGAYRDALVQSGRALDRELCSRGEIVLLGSIASDKYVAPLGEVFGARLSFPEAFIGRGDMSRGGLLLRAVDARQELAYVPAATAPRRGRRPPRLAPPG